MSELPRVIGSSARRTDALIDQFRKDLPALLKEADKLSAELTASVSGR
jgi:hypothetical protein